MFYVFSMVMLCSEVLVLFWWTHNSKFHSVILKWIFELSKDGVWKDLIHSSHTNIMLNSYNTMILSVFTDLISYWGALLLLLLRIGLAAAQALGKRGAHVVVSSRRQANVDKAVALLQSQNIQVTGTTCNVGKGEDREKLVQMASIFLFYQPKFCFSDNCINTFGRHGCIPMIHLTYNLFNSLILCLK